jgi:hypothetical protein
MFSGLVVQEFLRSHALFIATMGELKQQLAQLQPLPRPEPGAGPEVLQRIAAKVTGPLCRENPGFVSLACLC